LRTYEQQAATWDSDIERSDHHFYGPTHIQTAIAGVAMSKSAPISRARGVSIAFYLFPR
jgi:hypothetical protein